MAKQRKSHPGTIERRGNSFRIILYAGGERHTFTLPGVSKKDAEQFARTKSAELLEMADRQRLGLPGTESIDVLIQRFEAEKLPLVATNTRKSYAQSLKIFHRFLKAKRLDIGVHEFRRGHAKEFLPWARMHPLSGRAPCSGRTLERHRAVVHNLFALAEELELREGNPVSKVKPPKYDGRDPVLVNDEEFDRLLTACEQNPMLWTYVLTLGETGMRCESEALWIQWEDIDLDGGFVKIVSGRHDHRTKSGKGRWVPLTERLVWGLRKHVSDCRARIYGGQLCPWLFHHQVDRRHAKAGERIGSLRRALYNAIERAELPAGFLPHDLRHRRITKWLAEGKSAVLVKEAVGHADLRTTMGYTHLAKEHLRSLVVGEPTLDGLVQDAG